MNSDGTNLTLKNRLLDYISKFRSFPYVALVALTAIAGIAADSGAEIWIGNTCFNANTRDRHYDEDQN